MLNHENETYEVFFNFRYHTDRINRLLEGKIPPPITAELHLTNRCNYDCHWCVTGDRDKSLELATPKAKEILRQLRDLDVKSIIFTGGGEPTLHSDWLKILEYSQNIGLDNRLITNGLLLKEDIAEDVLKFTKKIKIGMDAASPELYSRIHNTSFHNFYLVLQNIRYLLETKKKINATAEIMIGYNVSEVTKRDMIKMAMLTKDYLKVDMVKYRPMELGKVGNGFRFDKISDIERITQECKRQCNGKPEIVFVSPHIMREGEYHLNFQKCYSAHFFAAIDAGTNMHICPYLIREKKYAYGNLRDFKLKELWESEERKRMINNIDFNDCTVCSFMVMNEIIEGYIKQGRLLEYPDEPPKGNINFIC